MSPSNPLDSPITISALNQAVARTLERSFPLIWVAGEISNFTRAASGHWYFTLKDDAAQVRAVMFRGRAQYASFAPKEGDKVEVRALVTLYTPRGDYQLTIEAMRRAGVGNLHEAFLQLKEKLQAAGLFAAERKKALPTFAKTIGIITSPQAAALRDVLTTLQRRAPHVRIILYPTLVQGAQAAPQIVQALTRAAARAECDVLLLCRGGGSIEDLWPFNEESVAHAIATCPIPVIAGIGHETDFTIADFVADLRAPTPTAAAELAATAQAEWLSVLETYTNDLTRALQRRLTDAMQRLDWLAQRLISPSAYLERERLQLQSRRTRLQHAWQMNITQTRLALHAQAAQLEVLNPQRTLERGYAIVTNAAQQIIRTPHALHASQTLTLRFAQGAAAVEITNVSPGAPTEKK